jgi:hypothetical protein
LKFPAAATEKPKALLGFDSRAKARLASDHVVPEPV